MGTERKEIFLLQMPLPAVLREAVESLEQYFSKKFRSVIWRNG